MDNRQLIMEKALELFCARGYDAVGVQEIAEQSGITKPTLYYYFGSKQGLMETILEENSRILEEMLEKAVEEPGDVPQVLYRVARAYFDFAGSHWQFYLFMLSQFYSGKKIGRIPYGVSADPEVLPACGADLRGFCRPSGKYGRPSGAVRGQLHGDSGFPYDDAGKRAG